MDTEGDMKANPLAALFRQATRTFGEGAPAAPCASEFRRLKEILDLVRAEHVRLDPAFEERALWENADKAPCTYIEMFQNRHFNMSIFVLRPNTRMPLHDHPHMHGLLKVIRGKVGIRRFTRLTDADDADTVFPVEAARPEIRDAESETCVLTPHADNYHEIRALDAPSAFLDILAPPYSTPMAGDVERRCRYYETVGPGDAPSLREVPLPEWFYCDQAPYLGPVLT